MLGIESTIIEKYLDSFTSFKILLVTELFIN
jgi:hypothetical protein